MHISHRSRKNLQTLAAIALSCTLAVSAFNCLIETVVPYSLYQAL